MARETLTSTPTDAVDSVNVAQLLKEQIGSTRQHDVAGIWREDDGDAACRLTGDLLLTRTDRGVWVSGTVNASVESTCGRCLVPFTTLVSFRIDEVFLPTVDVTTGASIHYDQEAEVDTFVIDQNHVLDLHEAIRQYRIAAMPVAMICKEGCKGLCQQCGADLNAAPCACEPPIDPRWDQLRELFAGN